MSESRKILFKTLQDDSEVLLILDPIVTMLSSESKLWLCIREVNALTFNGKSVPYLNLKLLSEEAVTVSYQIVRLWPAAVDEDPERVHDWCTYHMAKENSFTVAGGLIQPINPTLWNIETGWYIPIPEYCSRSISSKYLPATYSFKSQECSQDCTN